MKTLIAGISVGLFCLSAVYAQPTTPVKKIKYASPDGGHSKTYFVLKSDPDVKHGEFEEIYQEKVITHGEYDMGRQSGDWEFSSFDGHLKFSGKYNQGRKDGHWQYYRDNLLFSGIFYSDGVADSIFTYYDAYRPALQQRIDSAGSGDTYSFYPNGNVREHCPLRNRDVHGTVTMHFENGDVFRRVEYRNGQPYEVLETYDKGGEPLDGGTLKAGTGTYMRYAYSERGELSLPNEYITYSNGWRDGPYIKYAIDGGIVQQGEYIDGKKSGVWKEVDWVGSLSTTDKSVSNMLIQPGELSGGILKTSGGNVSREERFPNFQGGEKGMMKFLAANIHYPAKAKKVGAQGTTLVSFTVDSKGFIKDAEIVISIEESLDEECLRLVMLMPRWNPGFQDGMPVEVKYTMPLRFTMR